MSVSIGGEMRRPHKGTLRTSHGTLSLVGDGTEHPMGLLGEDFMGALRTVATLVVVYLLLLWAASVIWAYRDIRSRTTDVIAQAIGVAVVALMPFFGIALYLIVRPSETLAEAYERDLEREAMRSELQSLAPCPTCRRAVERDFLVCPYCRTVVREACVNCRKLLILEWRHCPYCGTSKPAPRPAPRYEAEEPATGRMRVRAPREEYEAEPAPRPRPQRRITPEE
jgi:RNA polymerase subunit RPABC4/transcription elongation factor Spt4